jgi:hypothetical protein
MLNDGFYRHEELVQKAVQIYCADYYLAQVMNGGHSQFINNCRANAPYMWSGARLGLAGMGAGAHAGILDRMVAWAQANPQVAEMQTGFDGGRAEALDELDDIFLAIEKTTPMIGVSTRWILKWPELRVVEDAGYEQALSDLAGMNPARAERQVARRIAGFRHRIDDWLHVSIGMATAAASTNELLVRINAGGSVSTQDGNKLLVWGVNTNKGLRYAYFTEDGVSLYAAVEGDDWRSMVGARLSHVEGDVARRVTRLANRIDAAAAVDLLLRLTGDEEDNQALSAVELCRDEAGAEAIRWIVASWDEPVIAITSQNGATLMRPGELQVVASVSADETARNAARYDDPGFWPDRRDAIA